MATTNLDALSLDGALTVAGAAAITGALALTGRAALSGGLTVPVAAAVAAAGSNSQANSTLLSSTLSIVATVSATTRGVRLPAAEAGLVMIVKNTATTQMNIYPATGDVINALSTNAAYDLVKAKMALFVAQDATTWHTILTA